MDDISRELPPDSTGATPVSERQKGPEELQRFELGHIGETAEQVPAFGDRLAGMGASFLADRILAVNSPPVDSLPGDSNPDGGSAEQQDADGPAPEEPTPEEQAEAAQPELADANPEAEAAMAGTVADELQEQDEQGVVVDERDAEPSDQDALAELAAEDDEAIDQDAANAAVAAEAGTVELHHQDDLLDAELGEDGLPIVPELTEATDVASMIYVLMMTSREGMTVFRL